MRMTKKMKMLIVIIAIASICFCVTAFWQQDIQKSILGEMKIKYVTDIDKVQLAQEDFLAEQLLSETDEIRLFQILSSTRKYNKAKDKSYLLNGSFLYSPKIYFDFDDDRHRIYWEYEAGIMYCDSIEGKRAIYYLEKENAVKLKELYEKYIDLRGVSRQ